VGDQWRESLVALPNHTKASTHLLQLLQLGLDALKVPTRGASGPQILRLAPLEHSCARGFVRGIDEPMAD
jgi:hypothetical protein